VPTAGSRALAASPTAPPPLERPRRVEHVSDFGPPPPPPEPPSSPRPPTRSTARGAAPDNPATYPSRPPAWVDEDIRRAETQRAELEAEMGRTGQANALVVAELSRISHPGGGACTSATWIEGRITILPRADTVVLSAVPAAVDGTVTETAVRWDVLARVCGRACWQLVPGLDPPRWITRRWPAPAELEVLAGLALLAR